MKIYNTRPEPNYGNNQTTFPLEDTAGPVGNWFGFPWDPTGYPTYPQNFYTPGNFQPVSWYMSINPNQWYLEESRIKGGYNNDILSLGVKAHLVDVDAKSLHRSSSLIYSGTLNNRTGINRTNVFSVAEDISRTVSPQYGAIEKLFSDDGNLLILQENKCSQALIDKDAIYTAEGSQLTTAGKVVIGPITPYGGEYGISDNPESFAVYGYRKYFSDKSRSAVLRLSKDGITEISEYGVFDYFRDELAKLKYKKQSYSLLQQGAFEWFDANGQVVGLGGFASSVRIEKDPCNLYYTFESGMGIITGSGATTDKYITQVVNSVPGFLLVYFSGPVLLLNPQDLLSITFQTVKKDKIKGAWDTNNKCYTISLQKHVVKDCDFGDKETTKTAQGIEIEFQTLNYDEKIRGWVSRFSYTPDEYFSVKNRFFSVKTIPSPNPNSALQTSIYKHYSDSSNRAEFYGETSNSNITAILNANPSVVKVFQTINYEGSNGWQMNSMVSSVTGADNSTLSYDPNDPATLLENDIANPVKSFYEGAFTVQEQPAPLPPIVTEFPNALPTGTQIRRGGFDRKENKYVSNIKNSSPVRPGEVIFGQEASGIKGFFCTVVMETDSTTNYGGPKELFSVGTNFVISST